MAISAQHNYESLKLVPSKIVALHKLIKLFKEFSRESMIRNINKDLEEELLNLEFNQKLEISNINEILEKTRSKFKKYMDSVSEKEFEFVEIASGIDIATYTQVKEFFGKFNEHMNSLYFDGHITMEIEGIEINKSNHWSIEEIPDDAFAILEDMGSLNWFFVGFAHGVIKKLSKNLDEYEKKGII